MTPANCPFNKTSTPGCEMSPKKNSMPPSSMVAHSSFLSTTLEPTAYQSPTYISALITHIPGFFPTLHRTLPTQRILWTVPRSPFAHKKSQENFDRKVHKRAIKTWDADPEVVDRWFAYLRKHALPGVGMKITKWHRLPIGFGATRLAHVEEKIRKRLDKGTPTPNVCQ